MRPTASVGGRTVENGRNVRLDELADPTSIITFALQGQRTGESIRGQ